MHNPFSIFVLFIALPISVGTQFVMEDPELLAIRRNTSADQLKLAVYRQCPMLASYYLPIEVNNWTESSMIVYVSVVLTRNHLL